MRLLTALVVALVLATLSWPSKADDGLTVGKMMEQCQRPDGDFFKLHCYTYVGAVIDVQTLYLLANASGPKQVCFPPQVVARQAAAVFVQWAINNPARHHEPAAVGIVESMIHAFPCSAP